MVLRTLIAVLAGSVSAAAVAQRPAEVMLLGSFHLANNNRDLINLPIEDVTTAARRAEIGRLVAGLARWKPTRIALEWPRSDQPGLDRRYADYRAGTLALSANERDQIGLRLAARLGLHRIDAIDWNGAAPGPSDDYDFMAWARANGQQARFARFVADGQAHANRTAAAMRSQTISQWYRALNTPRSRLEYQRPYFTIAAFGTDADNPGAAWVGAWYARNLRIFNNLRELATPGERVFVLYGSGHAHFLDGFMRESGAMRPVDPLGYLPRR
jgi:hypothetical protein